MCQSCSSTLLAPLPQSFLDAEEGLQMPSLGLRSQLSLISSIFVATGVCIDFHSPKRGASLVKADNSFPLKVKTGPEKVA